MHLSLLIYNSLNKNNQHTINQILMTEMLFDLELWVFLIGWGLIEKINVELEEIDTAMIFLNEKS
tara:strand:+ start:101 stop:295 length:195 start_codon:yes stop_codon:yes gene_type:complete